MNSIARLLLALNSAAAFNFPGLGLTPVAWSRPTSNPVFQRDALLRASRPLLLGSTSSGNKNVAAGEADADESCIGDECAYTRHIIKVHTVKSRLRPDQPWRAGLPSESTGSGFVIEYNGERQILTNAHVVADATYVAVRKSNEAHMYVATRRKISHECDLAILTVEDEAEAFWSDMEPLSFGTMPNLQDQVSVVGYPKGGDGISVTAGVISRIEITSYAHSGANLLAIQVDAAINSGNSGGPALDDSGRVVGVAFESLYDADNIGYLIPVPIIDHFLADTDSSSNGTRCTGFCSLGLFSQEMQDKQLREYYGVQADRDTGILIRGVEPLSLAQGMIQAGDIILALDNHSIAKDGTYTYSSRLRLSHRHIIQMKFPGENVRATVLRGNQTMVFDVPVQPTHRLRLVKEITYDDPQHYFLYGNVAFLELTQPFLETWGENWRMKAPKDLLNLYARGERKQIDEQPVVLAYCFASPRAGYPTQGCENKQVVKVNGHPVVNLHQMYKLVHELHASSDYLVFELDTYGGNVVVSVTTSQAEEIRAEVLELYRIPAVASKEVLES